MDAATEERAVAATAEWLESILDLLDLISDKMWSEENANAAVPSWLRVVAGHLKNTLFAPAADTFEVLSLTPYRVGFAMGILRWGDQKLDQIPAILKTPKKFRLSPRSKRKLGKVLEDFFLRGGFITRAEFKRSEFIPPDFKRYVATVERESGRQAAEFHRGMSDGLYGIGQESPMDRSNLTSEIYFAIGMWWRLVVRFKSTAELHRWLTRLLGSQKVGHHERIEKICQRIGLKFRGRGRPRKIQTLPLPG